MRNFKTLFPFVLAAFGFNCIQAQVVTSVVKDSATQQPIPYATILLANKKGVITNEEGRFSLLLDPNTKETDSLFISCMGYESLGKPLNEFKESVIFLSAKPIALNPVIVSNKQYTAEELIEQVKINIDRNYSTNLTKKRVFFRDSYHQNLTKSNYTFKESTIDALNERFLDSVLNSIPRKSSRYTEILGDFYGNYEKDNQKLTLIKASELYDKQSELDLTSLEEKFNDILKKNIKPDSYFKIKSGLFGTKVDADEFMTFKTDSTDAEALKKELAEKKKKEEDRKKNFASFKKGSLGKIMEKQFFLKDSDLNFINKDNRYHFKMIDFTYWGDDAVYILDFEPKRGADYKGRLYINADDFAIIRLDYNNVKSLRTFKLLGISLDQYLDRGKMIFSKNEDGFYHLRYLEEEMGAKVGIKRPLKIIELNKRVKGRNKQNELYIKLDMASSGINKHELILFDTQEITSQEFNAIKEDNSVLPTYMPNYDPEFWKGYNILEPNQAIKDFTAQVEVD
ncbi:carboxypeptidase-like regulatory domain-containing protein [Arenibacter sp. M-2]|uniref:carboxypeptidase-like regulatory domain-containing protein n=1 Tax=Arenibacter sp. M-2 TaxID=3053612 RepID=UPI00257123BB|nr:carboxypeptidase-like regulatory domain-containing protein [Arenibacter sp. M-2]MDL5514789.1 carboxypeptidase-like regulatory domain-containing protein [Arenibacter sp. M-2]